MLRIDDWIELLWCGCIPVSVITGIDFILCKSAVVLISPYPGQEGNKLIFCQNGMNFLRRLALQEKKTWWQLSSRCCWNRARPWHASELVSFLVGLRTYQHPGREFLEKSKSSEDATVKCSWFLTHFLNTFLHVSVYFLSFESRHGWHCNPLHKIYFPSLLVPSSYFNLKPGNEWQLFWNMTIR